jgi:hypothetical protein
MMMHTEEEARRKWGPFARDETRSGGSSWTGGERGGGTFKMAHHCIGSACMAWRWNADAAFKATAQAEFAKSGKRLSPTEGCCGLAGVSS